MKTDFISIKWKLLGASVLLVTAPTIILGALSYNTYKQGVHENPGYNLGLIIILACLIFIMLGAVAAYVFALFISRPIERLKAISLKAADGNLDVRVDRDILEKNDEIGTLARSFNIMIDNLRKNFVDLATSGKRFRDVAENAREWIWEVDEEGRFTYSNSMALEILGYSPGEILGTHFYDLFHPDDRKSFTEQFMAKFKEIQSLRDFVSRHVHKDGRAVWISTSCVACVGPRGEFTGFRGVNADITQRKEAEETLRESERKYRELYEGSRDGYAAVNMNGDILEFNSAYREMLGYTEDELKDMRYKDLTPEAWSESESSIIREQVIPRGYSDIYEKECRRKDGTIFPVELRTYLVRDKEGNPARMWAFIRDITERKKAEASLREAYERLRRTQEELIQAEKMNAIGQLASGVAHEVKNPLGVVLQGINFLESRKKNAGGKELKRIISAIKENIIRADNIIRALVDFSRATELQIGLHDMRDILGNALHLIQHKLKAEDIRVVKDFEEDLPMVRVDRMKMEQVFVNLFLNAVQAMAGGGVLTLNTYSTKIKVGRNRVGRRKSDFFAIGEKVVIVEVIDNGSGIKKEYLGRIFDPFFTTKEPGSGTGLGLSVTSNIVDMHRGLIEVDSEEGKGTKVRITLKAAR
ncbi:MAG: PAS domain S-box protein [Candidatus Omnitrophica bacterium]|nr:PAS domain S-box protein [Candidatus Omnitrophota bacterium]